MSALFSSFVLEIIKLGRNQRDFGVVATRFPVVEGSIHVVLTSGRVDVLEKPRVRSYTAVSVTAIGGVHDYYDIRHRYVRAGSSPHKIRRHYVTVDCMAQKKQMQ